MLPLRAIAIPNIITCMYHGVKCGGIYQEVDVNDARVHLGSSASLKPLMCSPCPGGVSTYDWFMNDSHAHAIIPGQVCYSFENIRTDFSDKIK